MPVTVIAAAGVVVVAGALLLVLRRSKAPKEAAPAKGAKGATDSLQSRLDLEQNRAIVVETFEKSMAGENAHAGPALARLGQLDTDEKLRLSAESLNLIGTLLAQEGQHADALTWLEQSVERDAAYFRTLNSAIAFEILRTQGHDARIPQYPFIHAPPVDNDVRTILRAQLLHNLDRPTDVEDVLAPHVGRSQFRFLRAECRRLDERVKDALLDYKAIKESDPEYADAQRWISQITGAPLPAGIQKQATPPAPPPAAPKTSTGTSEKPVAPPAAPKTATGTSDRVAPVAKPAAPPPPAASPAPEAEAPAAEEPPASEEPPKEPKRALATPQWNNNFDPRAVLGVGPSATLEEIRSAYLTLTKLHHPDRVTTKSPTQKARAEEKMRDINRAWRELTRDEAPAA